MAANMLAAYYDRSCDSSELFQNLKIAQSADYEKHRNQYDVIFLNIQQMLGGAGTPERVPEYIQTSVLGELKKEYPDLVGEDEKHLPTALASVYAADSRAEKGFVFILDEWDCIFREAKYDTKAQKVYLDFLKDLFKDRTYVAVAYMTGILPVKKYGSHSALNVFDEFSMTDPGVMAEYAGFTEDEVQGLCHSYQMDFEQVKQWYDGYLFLDEIHVYNPKSVVDAMKGKKLKSF